MTGLLAYGTYLPRHRLRAAEIGRALGSGGGRTSRAVASFDEDTTSMGVEAARAALAGHSRLPDRVYFATSEPPYLDKTNASVIHAALDLPTSCLAVDFGGAPRSATGALLAAADAEVPTLVVLAGIRVGLPGSTDEREGGDAAAALLFGAGSADAPVLASVLATASTTEEFLERWRLPGSDASRVWEERFGEHVYAPLALESFHSALKAADLTEDEVSHLIVCGLAPRAVKQFARSCGVTPGRIARDLTDVLGNPGAAQPGLLLADVLDRAAPDEVIAVVHLADGVTTTLLRTTEHIAVGRRAPSVDLQVRAPASEVSYTTFLTWRGALHREPPRRPEPDAPAAPASHRSSGYKHGFRVSQCDECGAVNVPPSRVCYSCGTADRMRTRSLSRTAGTVVTYTIDRLAFTPSPPMIAVVVDFDGGGRFRCELADAAPEDVRIGMRVELTFRRLLTANGVHNYFWKARPVTEVGEAD